MDRVFVSYSRRDQAWVDELVEALERAAVEVWIDRRDIPVSVPWLDELNEAIAGSTLFMVCRSGDWERSRHCAAEARTALELRKDRIEVHVGDDLGATSEGVLETLAGLSEASRARTHLLARARQWEQQNRPRSLLPTWRERRRLVRALAGEPRASFVEDEYLEASRRRTRGWRQAALGLAALPLIPAFFGGVLDIVRGMGSVSAIEVSAIDDVLDDIERSAYFGLHRVGALGFSESWLHAEALHMALYRPVPDDAFLVEGTIDGFGLPVIEDRVYVTTTDGSTWQRAVDDDVRHAVMIDDHGVPEPATTPTIYEIEVDPSSSQVVLRREGRVHRVVTADQEVDVAVLSPDGRTLAVGAGPKVHLIDVELGRTRVDLRGAPGSATDLAFSTDGARLYAAIDNQVVSWSVRAGERILDEPEQRFEGLLPSDRPDTAWVVVRDEGLRLIDTGTGATERDIELDDVVYGATADPGGRIAAVDYLEGFGIVDLRTGEHQRVDVDDCDDLLPAVAPDATHVYVPCRRGPVVVVDTAGAGELARLEIPGNGASAAGVATGTEELFVGGDDGTLWAVAGRDAEDLGGSRCRGEILAVAVAADSSVVVPVGIGTGTLGCSSRLYVGAEGPRYDSYSDYVLRATLARAAIHVPSRDAFVVGYDDGTIRVRPAGNIEPHHRFDEVHGTVKGLLLLDDGVTLLVATRSGVVHTLPLANVPLTNGAAAGEAERRMALARELGLTDLGSVDG